MGRRASSASWLTCDEICCRVPGSHLFVDDPGGGSTDADIEAWAVSRLDI